MQQESKKHFFISYNKADITWAEWIAWELEEAGYPTIVQAWDFRPGFNFVLRMQQASKEADRVIAVLSPDYLIAEFTQPEWAVAFSKDPKGEKGLLLPIRVRACELEGMLEQIVYIDLVDLEETTARQKSRRSMHTVTRRSTVWCGGCARRSRRRWLPTTRAFTGNWDSAPRTRTISAT